MHPLLQLWVARIRRWRLQAAGIAIAADADIQGPVCIRRLYSRGGWGSIAIGSGVQIARGAIIESWGGHVRLGQAVYVGPYSVIYGHGGVDIGNYTLIAMHCVIVSSNHAVPPLGRPMQCEPDVIAPTQIGRDVWLGAGVTVLAGVTIGDGCVVGAGAVVTKDLPEGAIALGVPAAVKGFRAK